MCFFKFSQLFIFFVIVIDGLQSIELPLRFLNEKDECFLNRNLSCSTNCFVNCQCANSSVCSGKNNTLIIVISSIVGTAIMAFFFLKGWKLCKLDFNQITKENKPTQNVQNNRARENEVRDDILAVIANPIVQDEIEGEETQVEIEDAAGEGVNSRSINQNNIEQ